MKKRVLIVEDEELMSEVIRDYFENDGFETVVAKDGMTAINLLDEGDYDIMLLDVMLPELDGFSVCRYVRKKNDIPIIMITARSEEDDKLTGYEMGADDYVTKPFSPKVLVAKANALLKRSRGNVCGEIGVVREEGIEINENSHTVTVDGEYVDFTPKEFELLLYFMNNKGRVLSRDMLLSKVWGYDYFGDLRTVDTHVKKLRAKLGTKAEHIKTLVKAGYKFE